MNIYDKRNAFSLQQKKAVLVAVLNQHSEDNIQRRSPKSLAIIGYIFNQCRQPKFKSLNKCEKFTHTVIVIIIMRPLFKNN